MAELLAGTADQGLPPLEDADRELGIRPRSVAAIVHSPGPVEIPPAGACIPRDGRPRREYQAPSLAVPASQVVDKAAS
jgi:hypothetical protein